MKIEDILISPTDFDAFTEQVNYLKSRMLDKPTSIMPHLAIKTMDMEGKVGLTLCALAVDFNEEAEKRAILETLGRKTHERKLIPMAIALSTEAWLATNPPKGTEPRHCENKKEVVILGAQSIGKKLVKFISIPVRRDPQNRMEPMEDSLDGHEIKSVGVPILDNFFRGFAEALMAATAKRQ